MDASASENGLHRALLEFLAQPEHQALIRGPAENALRPAVFPRPGLFIGLLGFDDGDRDHMADTCRQELLQSGLPLFARPIGKGGLLAALAASCLHTPEAEATGAAVVLPAPRHIGAGDPPGIAEQLFAEIDGRFLVCLPPERQTDARLLASEHGVPFWPLGRTGGRELVVRAAEGAGGSSGPAFHEVVRLPLAALFEAAHKGSVSGL